MTFQHDLNCEARVFLETGGEALFSELKTLLLELSRMNIAEFDLEYRDIRIVVRKNGNGAGKLQSALAAASTILRQEGFEAAPIASQSSRPVTSPLTGVFYLAPSPTAPPFVQEGEIVQEGQVVGLVEAMKVFNEIKTEWSGRVIRICARNGELVQTSQPLVELAPLA